MKRTFNGIEFTEIEYSYNGETLNGLLVHDLNDTNRDGDGIMGNGVDLPETAEEAQALIETEFIETSFRQRADGIYAIGTQEAEDDE